MMEVNLDSPKITADNEKGVKPHANSKLALVSIYCLWPYKPNNSKETAYHVLIHDFL